MRICPKGLLMCLIVMVAHHHPIEIILATVGRMPHEALPYLPALQGTQA
ncbi:hypothetical protein LMG19144_03797 [Xanthomonas arboricola pv. fragariae]|nr:hypothetical protein LMG19144_03797 [Xanthomonas arboricola pv. fragariae]